MIGKSVPRVDAYDKVTGRAKFTDDLVPANCHVQLRTSEHRSMYSYVRLSIDRCTAYVRLSIDRCTATYVLSIRSMYSFVRLRSIDVQLRTSSHRRCTLRTSGVR